MLWMELGMVILIPFAPCNELLLLLDDADAVVDDASDLVLLDDDLRPLLIIMLRG